MRASLDDHLYDVVAKQLVGEELLLRAPRGGSPETAAAACEIAV
jgi:hypothetical protein